MTGGHGTSQPAPDPQKCLDPSEGGVGFGSGDSGLTAVPTVISGGAGLQAFGTFVGASTLSWITLPAFNGEGNADLGFLSGVPDFVGLVTQPEGRGAWMSRGRILIGLGEASFPSGEKGGGVIGKDWKPAKLAGR
jgi:hypothetical protein